MNSALPKYPMMDCEIFAEKADMAWKALQSRFAAQIAEDQIDYLLARYVLGLTSPFYGEDDPHVHLHVCQTVLKPELPADRIEKAMKTVPQASEAWIERAFDTIEELGIRDGRMLLDHVNPDRIASRVHDDDAPSTNPSDHRPGDRRDLQA